jgi:hypothetical protein
MVPLGLCSWHSTRGQAKRCTFYQQMHIDKVCYLACSDLLIMHLCISRALKKILTTPNTADQPQYSPTSSVTKDYGIPVTTLREIKHLKQVNHDNCVELIEIAFEKGTFLPSGLSLYLTI